MKLHNLFLTVLVSTLAFGCSSGSKDGDGGDYEAATLGSGYEYFGDGSGILVGPQPSEEDIKEMKSDGDVAVIINVRAKKENRKVKFSPKGVAKSVGIKYYQIPIMKNRKPSKSAAEKISRIVKKAGGKKVLVYCSSGNRAAAWYGIHRAMNGEMSTSQAVTAATNMGLNNRKLKGLLTGYLASSGLTKDEAMDEATEGAEEAVADTEGEAQDIMDGGEPEMSEDDAGQDSMDSVEESLETDEMEMPMEEE